jgi:hypothetical protein
MYQYGEHIAHCCNGVYGFTLDKYAVLDELSRAASGC